MKKKFAAAALLVMAFAMLAQTASADRYRRGTNDHPFKIVAYVIHAVGHVAEFGVMRPVHWVVSQPYLDIVFGHKAMPYEDQTFFEFRHGDFTPTISRERELSERAQRVNR